MMLHHHDNNVRRSIVSSYHHGNCLQIKILAPKEEWVDDELIWNHKDSGRPHINSTGVWHEALKSEKNKNRSVACP